MELSPTEDSPQDSESIRSTAFVVHFDSPVTTRRLVHNKRMRHMRNLSLPITGVYNGQLKDSITSSPNILPRCAGYHSEGYFSSDQEDDSSRSLQNNLRRKSLGSGDACTLSPMAETAPSINDTNNNGDDESDTLSDAGTYTIDRESSEVRHARKAIEKVFGILDENHQEQNFKSSESDNSSWVTEWATRLTAHSDPAPSPTQENKPICSPLSPLRLNRHGRVEDDSALETTSFLRATESVVSAMTARMAQSLSLDSGDESSDISDTPTPAIRKRLAPATTEIAAIQTRHNRAFSLRRARLGCDKDPIPAAPVEDRKKGAVVATEPAVMRPSRKGSLESPRAVTNTSPKTASPKTASPKTASPKTASPKTASPRASRPEAFARTDCGRFSMRTSKSMTPPAPVAKKDSGIPKSGKKLVGIGSGTRSNSTLSSREVEFQNWKRRKSYDPMKSAAEGKKKDPKKLSSILGGSVTGAGAVATTAALASAICASAATAPLSAANAGAAPLPSPTTSPTNHVLRSASFHGTHGLIPPYGDFCDSEEDDFSQGQGTPPQVTCPSPAHPAPMQHAMDNLVIVALSGLSQKLKGSSSNLLKKLRYLYEADSAAAERLDMQIYLLEEMDKPSPSSPALKSPSRELSATLRNLKRLEGALQVLDEVLFEDEDMVLY